MYTNDLLWLVMCIVFEGVLYRVRNRADEGKVGEKSERGSGKDKVGKVKKTWGTEHVRGQDPKSHMCGLRSWRCFEHCLVLSQPSN